MSAEQFVELILTITVVAAAANTFHCFCLTAAWSTWTKRWSHFSIT